MLLLFALTTLSGTFAFRWTSSSTFPNGTVLKNCIGDNVTLPWTFTTKSTDRIFIEWIKLSDGQDKSILASYNQDTLFKSNSKRWLEFVPNAGLLLPDVTLSDTGNYSVQIRVRNEAQIYQQSAFVRVSKKRPTSCDDVKKYDKASGIHTLFLLYNKTINVFCDQTTDNGGWLVIQRRQDGSVDFDRDWEEYELGFGNLKTEFWIGLGSLYRLTKSKNFRLRVDLTEFGGTTTYAVYNTFSIGGVPDNYRLRVDGYSGTAGNDLSLHNDMQFSTPERDHDTFKTGNCARMFTGGWWFGFCVDVNLNGRYNASRVFWKDRLLKHVEMKIKL